MKKILYTAIALLGSLTITNAQSDTPCASPTAITVSTTCVYQTVDNIGATEQTDLTNGGTPSCSAIGEDSWYTFVAPASGNVEISTLAGSITDAGLAVYTGVCSALAEVGCNDDNGPGAMPFLPLTGLVSGQTYYLRIWEYGGGTGDFELCIKDFTPATNLDCANSAPICSGSSIVFSAESAGSSAFVEDPGNDYDCLGSAPNPTWYYFEIDDAGDIEFDITAASDIDFVLWGPFANLFVAQAACGSYSNVVDCSYSTSAVEQANVTGVGIGEVYVLLVTNYSGAVQDITLSEGPGMTASTDCSIVPVLLPITLSSFTAFSDAETVALNWVTSSEQNNKVFEVQRRSRQGFWSTIAIQEGAGNSNTAIRYAAEDKSPLEGVNYYRLKQTDFDGKFSYSDIISTNGFMDEAEVALYPNPAAKELNIKSEAEILAYTVKFTSGKVVKTKTEINEFSTQINLNDFKPGIYLLELKTKTGTINKKFTKI